jgi:hypothetical protein
MVEYLGGVGFLLECISLYLLGQNASTAVKNNTLEVVAGVGVGALYTNFQERTRPNTADSVAWYLGLPLVVLASLLSLYEKSIRVI